MEHKELISSLESQLTLIYLCSIRIPSRNKIISKNCCSLISTHLYYQKRYERLIRVVTVSGAQLTHKPFYRSVDKNTSPLT